jgi:predicted nuclease with TOPRIM domain
MDNDLETLLNETLEEFPEKDLESQEFLKQFSQNIQIQESVKETIDSMRSEKDQPEENIDDLLDNLNSLMDNGELDSLLSNVMDQIVSKDLLYEPMKDLASKYPDFLLKSENNIDQVEYKRFQEQFRIVKEIISVYDTENDSVKVLKLMQDVITYALNYRCKRRGIHLQRFCRIWRPDWICQRILIRQCWQMKIVLCNS